jgi:TRAP-type C4-dicarboxylate transport system permease small subunit
VLIDLCIAALFAVAMIWFGWRALVDGVAAHLESDDPSPAPAPALLHRDPRL